VLLLIFILANGALLRVKLKDPTPPGVWRTATWVPVAAIVLNLVLLSVQSWWFLNG